MSLWQKVYYENLNINTSSQGKTILTKEFKLDKSVLNPSSTDVTSPLIKSVKTPGSLPVEDVKITNDNFDPL